MLSMLVCLFLEDDRPLFMALESVAAEQEPLLATSTTGLLAANAVEEIITQPLTQVRKPANRFHQYWQSLHKSMKETNQLFTSSRVTQYASLGFLATSFGKQLFQPLIQYVSVRFGIPIAKVRLFVNGRGLFLNLCLGRLSVHNQSRSASHAVYGHSACRKMDR